MTVFCMELWKKGVEEGCEHEEERRGGEKETRWMGFGKEEAQCRRCPPIHADM